MFTKLCYDVDQATFTVDSGPTQYQSRPICWVWSGMELPALIEKRVQFYIQLNTRYMPNASTL